jgi:hypothetical protein
MGNTLKMNDKTVNITEPTKNPVYIDDKFKQTISSIGDVNHLIP